MSRTPLRVNPHSVVAGMSRNSLVRVQLLGCAQLCHGMPSVVLNNKVQVLSEGLSDLVCLLHAVTHPGPFLAVCCKQSSHAITCPFSNYFQILYIFAPIFQYFALFCPFLNIFCSFLPFF